MEEYFKINNMAKFKPTSSYTTIADMEENTIKEYFEAFPDMTMDEIGSLLDITARSLYTKCKQYNSKRNDRIDRNSSSNRDNNLSRNTL